MKKTVSPNAGKRPFWRRAAKVLLVGLGLLVVVGAAAGLYLRNRLAASLPRLEGEVTVGGLAASVRVDRDALGIPTLRGADRRDLAFGLGFLHAQERFFQMDLGRRQAAGELAELFGARVLPADREMRIHRFRARAADVFEASPADVRSLAEAYTEGVNAGLDDLGAYPFEYLFLRAEPVPWRAEDTVLMIYSMFHLLQSRTRTMELGLGLMHDRLPGPLFDFLVPRGSQWDAPLAGESFTPPPPPGPEVVDLRQASLSARGESQPLGSPPSRPAGLLSLPVAGSNNWAVAAAHTRDGGALLANDMHLPLSVPNIWYRASFSWPSEDGTADHRITGITLPGTPLMVVGSNSHVAWGFTNTGIDISDVVLVELAAGEDDAYLTPGGPRRFERHAEVLRAKGGAEETLEVVSTVWGPLLENDHRGRRRALRWLAHDAEAVNFELFRLEQARTVDEALEIAPQSGLPAQNFIVADSAGRIAWTIAGKIPRRAGVDGKVPRSWADGSRRWDGLLAPEEYPRHVDPPSGRLWTANNRVVGGETLDKLGDGGYVSGARAGQIRDQLLASEQLTAADMLAIQLDDRALFLERWRQLFLDALTPEAVAADPRRQTFRELVADWGGRASTDSVGYRLVRFTRRILARQVFTALTLPCQEIDPEFSYIDLFALFEGPLWQLVSERPLNLLSPEQATWDDQLLAAVDELIDYYEGVGGALDEQAWGRFNAIRIQHPLSQALPFVGQWLDMPVVQLPGDSFMPRVQVPGFGASQRMVVSPGREAEGIFHMPGGQSGHPSSPHYRDAQAAWANGEATPFLPGPTVHELSLLPAG